MRTVRSLLLIDGILDSAFLCLQYRWNVYKTIRQQIDENEGGMDKFTQGNVLFSKVSLAPANTETQSSLTHFGEKDGWHLVVLSCLDSPAASAQTANVSGSFCTSTQYVSKSRLGPAMATNIFT